MPRIAHVSDCFLPRLGGIERQVHDLAAHQLAAGYDVEVITSVSGADASTPGLTVLRPADDGRPAGTVQFAAAAGGRDRMLRGRYDVVHVHLSTVSPLGLMAIRAACAAGIPVVVTVHSLWGPLGPVITAAGIAARAHRWPVVWSAVSTVAAESLRATLGGSVTVHVLPNAVDDPWWSVPPHSCNPGLVVVASVLRLAPRKRALPLLHVLRAARRRIPADIDLRLRLIGDGPQQDRVRRYVSRHGMAAWTDLTGRLNREQIREHYCSADMFVAPATLESFGIAALEARSAGLPVIAHRTSGVADFVRHGREGLLVDGDRGLVDAVVALATAPGLRARIAAHNHATSPPMNWTSVTTTCDQLYARAAGAHLSAGAVPAGASR